MIRWGHVARKAAVAAAALGALTFGVQPAVGAVGTGPLTKFKEVRQQGDYEAGGTGMVGSGEGEIVIAGIPPTSSVTHAYLYWVLVGPEGSQSNPAFAAGTFNGVPITGQLVAIGEDPCRDPDPDAPPEWKSFVYRADVKAHVLPGGGNGSYTLAGFASGPFGLNDPFDPFFFESSDPPINEGASLVLMYQNPVAESRVVVLYEGALAVDPFELGQTTLTFPRIAAGQARTTYGVADGQNRFDDDTLFNGSLLARNEGGNEMSFSGSNGSNLDTDTYDVTALVDPTPGDTSATAGIGRLDDCLLHFVQVFSAPVPREESVLLTLTPPTAAVEIGQPHTVTATVTNETLVPIPNTLVRFDVSGSVEKTGSCTTNSQGQCSFTFDGPDLPGAVTITAYADIDRDAVQDVGEPTGAATAEFVIPKSTPLCDVKIYGGGWFRADNGDIASFSGSARAEDSVFASGTIDYVDHGPHQPSTVKGNVLAVVCSGDNKSATIFGKATVNGVGPVDFRVDVKDNGSPGAGRDRFRIRFLAYDSGDHVICAGEIRIIRF